VKISELMPQPHKYETFERSRVKFVPESYGCYVLSTFQKDVLYVGLAKNLRRRMNDHLNSDEKTGPTILGRAIYFSWLECQEREREKIERTWMNIHTNQEGRRPPLNRVSSPISI
jgi:excinuclease UvrABC nuclease subunit